MIFLNLNKKLFCIVRNRLKFNLNQLISNFHDYIYFFYYYYLKLNIFFKDFGTFLWHLKLQIITAFKKIGLQENYLRTKIFK